MPRVDESVEQLVMSAERGDLQQVKDLVEGQQVSVDALSSRRECALHVAVRRGRTECVRYLLLRNASVDIVDADGNWPIHLAARSGLCEMIAIVCVCFFFVHIDTNVYITVAAFFLSC